MTRPSLRDLAMLARLTRDFPGFIRTPITSEQAVEIIRGRLAALVTPRIGRVDEERIRGLFVDELGRDGGFTRADAEVRRRAGTVQVKRQWPVATKAGTILPFHVIKR